MQPVRFKRTVFADIYWLIPLLKFARGLAMTTAFLTTFYHRIEFHPGRVYRIYIISSTTWKFLFWFNLKPQIFIEISCKTSVQMSEFESESSKQRNALGVINPSSRISNMEACTAKRVRSSRNKSSVQNY